MNIKNVGLLNSFSITELTLFQSCFEGVSPIVNLVEVNEIINKQIENSEHPLVSEELEYMKKNLNKMNLKDINYLISNMPFDLSAVY